MRIPRFAPSRTVLVVALLMAAALTTAAWLGLRPQSPPAEPDFPSAEATPAPATAPAGPPWRYGRADARFTVVEYADLEGRSAAPTSQCSSAGSTRTRT